MSKTYALADLHGRFDLLEMALACIAEHVEPPATLVTLGDYVDRGPDSRKIIERLMAGLGHDGWRLTCLKGNHEDIMWQTCRRLPDVDWWLTNGGGATLISREELFHGVRALRLIPQDERKVFGRAGLLAHSFLLGPNGDSNGCVSFRNYDAFLQAYLNQEVKRLAVVARLE